ncbi:MAG: anaerobic ribonucleoside-triphosphate reductase activating protein [Eubacteriaceae bacterium]|nr:anaerobic ribonucleoside-triphosphate reductase activating protein [Eubacteriaceae bacterium]
MNIGGLQKLTLLDYPGRTACTVFLEGCDFRCPFCHNWELCEADGQNGGIPEEKFFSFLKKRRNMLEGVCISGGEPLMSPDIIPFAEKIKAIGYDIKIDTNGSYPARLRSLAEAGLVDYAAVDIKNSKKKYAETSGSDERGLAEVEKTVSFLMEGSLDYEFRTTVVKEFHDADDFEEIGRWIRGAKRYYLQMFRDRDSVMTAGLHPQPEENMRSYLKTVRKYVPSAKLRGEA